MANERAIYSHGHHSSVVKSHARRTAENSAAFLLGHIKPGDRILDVGCGPGSITIGLARAASEGEVIGGDSVSTVIEEAQALAAEHGVRNVSFQTLDANDLPFADDSFDVVFCHQVLQHVGDPVRVLTEMRRVAKSHGLVAARDADYAAFAWFPETPGLDAWAQLYQRIARANGAQPNAGRYLPRWARDAGFAPDDVTFSWDCWNYQREDARAFGRSWIERSLHSGYATTAKQHGLADDPALEQISEAWRSWSEADGAFVVIPNGEILCRVR